MTEGRDSLHDTILIAGAFNNYPAIVVWSTAAGMDNHLSAISSIPGSYALAGLITSVVQAYIPEDAPAPVPVPPPTPPPQPTIRTDYAFLVVVGGVGMGIVLGLVIAIGCLTRAGFQLVNLPPNLGHPKPDAPLGPGMPLTTLSGSGPGALADFRICFERAMSARHLPTHETLLIINPQEITLSRIIGEGSFGRVWNGNWRNNAVAVKEFVFAQAAIEGGSLQHNSIIEEIVGEAGIMACLRHPKILQLYGCSLTMQAIWIVSELCIRGSLRMVLSHKSVPLSTQTKLALCMDIADGMHYLHSRTPPIIHRDLKSLNIFITETSPGKLVAKIGDWGSARAVALTGQKSMTQGVGTACWLSPEVISNAHFSKHSDVYAFGIILWEVFTRQEVYAGLSAAQIISKVAHESLRPTIPRGCLWEQIMTSCWDRDPELRPSFNTVLQELNKILTAERGTLDGIPLDSIGQSEESDFLIPNNNSAQSSFDVTESSDWVTSGQGYPPKPLTLTPPRTPHHPPAHHTPSPSVPIAGGGSTGSNRHSAHKPKGVLKIRSDAPPALAASPSAEPTPRTSQPYMQGGLPPDSPGTSPGQFPRSASAPHVPATQGNIYRNELPLNFDVSDLIGPTYYIMKELSDDDIEADPLDFLFAKHKRAEAKPPLPVQASPTANHHHPRGSPVTTPPAATRTAAARAESPSVPEVYIGDKALKPYTSRKRSGSGASTNRSNH
jgi:serine/threonine protein kinase